MLTDRQAESILMGAALLECVGNLYQYTGCEGRTLYFRDIATNRQITMTYEAMIAECDIQY